MFLISNCTRLASDSPGLLQFEGNGCVVIDYLMVELWSNSHIQVHVQLIVIGDERLGHSSPWNDVHHGSFNLKQTERNSSQIIEGFEDSSFL